MSIEKGFNYWHPDHYEIKVVTGSLEVCMSIFKSDQAAYPTREYGTHVSHRDCNSGPICKFVIKRFKTKELCKLHLDYPPTYVREGRSI